MTDQEIYNYCCNHIDILNYQIDQDGNITLKINTHYSQWSQEIKNVFDHFCFNIGYNGCVTSNGWKDNDTRWHSRLGYEPKSTLPRHDYCDDNEERLTTGLEYISNPSASSNWRLLPRCIQRVGYYDLDATDIIELKVLSTDYYFGSSPSNNFSTWRNIRRSDNHPYEPYTYRFSMNIAIRFMSIETYGYSTYDLPILGESVHFTMHLPVFIWETEGTNGIWKYHGRGEKIKY